MSLIEKKEKEEGEKKMTEINFRQRFIKELSYFGKSRKIQGYQ